VARQGPSTASRVAASLDGVGGRAPPSCKEGLDIGAFRCARRPLAAGPPGSRVLPRQTGGLPYRQKRSATTTIADLYFGRFVVVADALVWPDMIGSECTYCFAPWRLVHKTAGSGDRSSISFTDGRRGRGSGSCDQGQGWHRVANRWRSRRRLDHGRDDDWLGDHLRDPSGVGCVRYCTLMLPEGAGLAESVVNLRAGR